MKFRIVAEMTVPHEKCFGSRRIVEDKTFDVHASDATEAELQLCKSQGENLRRILSIVEKS